MPATRSKAPKPDLVLGWPKAYPLKHQRKCAHIATLDVSGDPDMKLPPDEGLQFRLDAGIEFETEIGDLIAEAAAKSGLDLVVIELDRTVAGKKRAEKATLAAMAAGADIIWNGRIRSGKKHKRHLTILGPDGNDVNVALAGSVGEPDMLVLVNREDVADGVDTPRYAAVDVKWHITFEGTSKAKDWPASEFGTPFPDQAAPYSYKGYPKLDDALQLVHYQEILDDAGFSSPTRLGGIIGKEQKIIWVGLDDRHYTLTSRSLDGTQTREKVSAQEYYDHLQAEHTQVTGYELLRDGDDSVAGFTQPEKKTACKECSWRQVCMDTLVEQNHISLLPGLTPTRLGPHYKAGVTTISALARLDRDVALLIDTGVNVAEVINAAEGLHDTDPVTRVNGGSEIKALTNGKVRTVRDLRRLHPQTVKYSGTRVHRLAHAIDQARVWVDGKPHRARGVSHVQVQVPAVVVHNDIEDTGGDFCYLIGNHVTIRRRGKIESEYKAFVTWERTEESEAAVFADFWAWLNGLRKWVRRNKIGGFVAYHYTDHETRFYRHLAEKHAGKPGIPTVDELNEFLDGDDWVDLYKIVSNDLIWPCKDHTVKTLAQQVGFCWRDDNPSGAASTAWAQIAMDDPDPKAREEMRERILAYNEDDVLATEALVAWLHRNTAQARRPGAALPEVSALDKRFQPKRRLT